jgi:hypothetical protein
MRNKINTVILATLLGVGLGAVLGFGPLQLFKSEGVLNMELGASEYKRFTELANDAASFKQYATVSPPPGMDAEQFQSLLKTVAKGEWHKPVPKVSKTDAKELPDVVVLMERDREREKEKEKEKEVNGEKNKRKEGAVYLGLRVTHTAHEPVEAVEVATWLGGYFKQVATREAVRELVSNWAAENRQFSDRALEQQLKFKFDIEQVETRSAELKKLVARYPEAGVREGRQVVDVRKENEKFMSPVAQLVAAESQIIDIKEKSQKLNREIEQHAFAAPLVGQAELSLKQVGSGSEGVNKLATMLAEYSKKVKTDAEREKLLTIAADVSQIAVRFLSQAEFIALPSLPSRPERPTPLMYMAFLGLLFAALSAVYSWRKELINLLRDESVAAAP